MKHLKISIETAHDKEMEGMDEVEHARHILAKYKELKANKELLAKAKAKPEKKKVSSISDLRKLQEEPNMGMEEESLAHEKAEDAKVEKGEADGEDRNDDKAMKEDKASRIKNSKHPTVVGKRMI